MPAHSGVIGERVAVQRQPDALQPDDQHELQPAARDRASSAGQVAGRERADPEQAQRTSARRPSSRPRRTHQHADADRSARRGPTGSSTRRLAAVRLDAVGDGDEQHGRARRERHVADQSIRPAALAAVFAQAHVRPDRAERRRTARSPRRPGASPWRQQPAERAGRGTARRCAAIWLMPSAMPRWLAGNASVRIAAEFAISMAPPTPCTKRQPISHSAPLAPVQRVEGQGDRGEREDEEAEVVNPHPAVHVAEPAQGDDEHRRDEQIAHDHPQEVADVGRRQRVQVDAAEDRWQRHDDDRARRSWPSTCRASCSTARSTCTCRRYLADPMTPRCLLGENLLVFRDFPHVTPVYSQPVA